MHFIVQFRIKHGTTLSHSNKKSMQVMLKTIIRASVAMATAHASRYTVRGRVRDCHPEDLRGLQQHFVQINQQFPKPLEPLVNAAIYDAAAHRVRASTWVCGSVFI